MRLVSEKKVKDKQKNDQKQIAKTTQKSFFKRI